MSAVMTNGTPTVDWNKVDFIIDSRLGVSGELMCWLDLNFLRPGKDAPPPVVAGRAMDRIGLMLFSPTSRLKSADRVRCIDGPVTGTFEIRNNPDPAISRRPRAHHYEVQIIEVAQSVEQAMKVQHP